MLSLVPAALSRAGLGSPSTGPVLPAPAPAANSPLAAEELHPWREDMDQGGELQKRGRMIAGLGLWERMGRTGFAQPAGVRTKGGVCVLWATLQWKLQATQSLGIC